MKKKIDFKSIAAAASTGAGFNFAIEGAAKRVDFVYQNFAVIKSLSAGLIGTGMVYFGKNEMSKAAGYALIGVAGASAATKLSTVLVSSEEPMQGIGRMKKRLQRAANNPSIFRKLAERSPAGMIAKKMMQPGVKALPNQTQSANCATPYGQMALADTFYN